MQYHAGVPIEVAHIESEDESIYYDPMDDLSVFDEPIRNHPLCRIRLKPPA